VVCVASSDMKNWTDHGEIFRAETDTSWAKKTWAPAAIERDGKFFLYFGNGGGNIGVVVGDKPTGPFKDVRGTALIDGKTPGVKPAEHLWLFDPAAFIDDDGQAYLYFGGNGDDNVRIAKLKPDMVSLDGDVIKMSAPNFFEAAWLFKRKGLYYFAYSTLPKAQMRIDYMTSNRPTSGFEYRGVVADQPPVNQNNNHAAEFEFKGHWYHVYHNRIVSKEAGIPPTFRRNIAIECMDFQTDGSIKKVAYTVDGVPQIGHLDPYARLEGETFHSAKGVKTEQCKDGGMDLTDLRNGAYIKLSGVDFHDGARRFEARIASAGQGGTIEIRLDGPDGKLVGTCRVGNTGGWQSWTTVGCDVEGTTGIHDLCLKFCGGGDAPLYNLDHYSFQK